MTVGVSYSVKVEPGTIPNRKAFWDVIDYQMRVEGQEYKRLYKQWVSTWESKPSFNVIVKTKPREGVSVGQVFPQADQRLIDIMMWLDQGTGIWSGRGWYPIIPKGDYPLIYQKTYTPATQPGIIQAGPSSYSGPIVKRRGVMHPGIRPRLIRETILLQRHPHFRRNMARALRRAVANSERAGRKG